MPYQNGKTFSDIVKNTLKGLLPEALGSSVNTGSLSLRSEITLI